MLTISYVSDKSGLIIFQHFTETARYVGLLFLPDLFPSHSTIACALFRAPLPDTGHYITPSTNFPVQGKLCHRVIATGEITTGVSSATNCLKIVTRRGRDRPVPETRAGDRETRRDKSQVKMTVLRLVRIHWRSLVFVFTPFVFLPLVLVSPTSVSRNMISNMLGRQSLDWREHILLE